MQLHFLESLVKQSSVVYKNIPVEHYPYTMTVGKESFDIDGWVIKSPYYLQSNNSDEKIYLPLSCENEDGEVVNFATLDDAKKYIDKYIEPKKGKIKVKHRNEIHYELNQEKMDESHEPTFYSAKKAFPNYIQKYGVVSGGAELYWNFHLRPEELKDILADALQKGLIDELDKDNILREVNLNEDHKKSLSEGKYIAVFHNGPNGTGKSSVIINADSLDDARKRGLRLPQASSGRYSDMYVQEYVEGQKGFSCALKTYLVRDGEINQKFTGRIYCFLNATSEQAIKDWLRKNAVGKYIQSIQFRQTPFSDNKDRQWFFDTPKSEGQDAFVYDIESIDYIGNARDNFVSVVNESLKESLAISGHSKEYTKEELIQLEKELYAMLKGNGIYPEDGTFSPYRLCDLKLNLILSGDWKHTHIFVQNLVNEFCEEHKLAVLNHSEETIGDTDDDSYQAEHIWFLEYDEDGTAKEKFSRLQRMFK